MGWKDRVGGSGGLDHAADMCRCVLRPLKDVRCVEYASGTVGKTIVMKLRLRWDGTCQCRG